MTFKNLINESPVGKVGRTTVKDAHIHITPELKKEFFDLVKKLGGKTVVSVLLNNIAIPEVGTSDSVLKKYKDNNYISANRLNKPLLSEDNEANEINEDIFEDALIKNNIKIKSKFETKFGTEFILARKYDKNEIKKILDGYRVTFDNDSIFVTK